VGIAPFVLLVSGPVPSPVPASQLG
jgi:hypothetical protein